VAPQMMRKVVSACILIAAAPVTDGIGVAASYSVNTRTDSAMIEALKARGPHASLGEAAGVFGQLVGTWDLTCERYAADGTRTSSRGVWHFGWIVDGRMIQDVIYFFPAGQPAERVGGTTLRFYDTQAKQWRVIFFAPARNAVISLVGGRAGDRIVLLGTDVDGSALRWSFNDIKSDSLYWKGEISSNGGKTWRVEQEMHLTRHMPRTGSKRP
jgi:hypothetical protein